MCVLKILPNRTEGRERKCVFFLPTWTNELTLTWNRIDMLGDKLQTWTWKLQRFVGKETTEKMWRKKIHWKKKLENLRNTFECNRGTNTHNFSNWNEKKVTMKSTDTKRQTAGRTTKCFYVWNRFNVWCPRVADWEIASLKNADNSSFVDISTKCLVATMGLFVEWNKKS